MVSKVNFNPPCLILNKRSQPNDILGTDRTKQVERMVGNRRERDTHSLYMQHHQMAKLGWDACTMLCVQNNSLPSKRQHNRCLMLKDRDRMQESGEEFTTVLHSEMTHHR
jgi:hypothetical protein